MYQKTQHSSHTQTGLHTHVAWPQATLRRSGAAVTVTHATRQHEVLPLEATHTRTLSHTQQLVLHSGLQRELSVRWCE